MHTISNVLAHLTPAQRQRIADRRHVTVRGLAKSYAGDWVGLVKDLNSAELRRALTALSDSELRIAALRAFDGRRTELDDIAWKADGTARKRRQARGVVEALCNWAPKSLQARTWETDVVRMLRDIGIESTDTPAGGDDLVQLRRIFS